MLDGEKLRAKIKTPSHHLPPLFFRFNFTPSFPAPLPFPQSWAAQRVRTGTVVRVGQLSQLSCAAPSPFHCSLLTFSRGCRETMLWCLEHLPRFLLLPPCCSYCCFSPFKTVVFGTLWNTLSWQQLECGSGAQKNPVVGTLEPAGICWAQLGQPLPLQQELLRFLPASTSPPAFGRAGKEPPKPGLDASHIKSQVHSLFLKAHEVGQIWKGCSCLDTLS